MKSLVLASVILALSTSVQAQTIPLHTAPQGVTSCTVPDTLTVHTIGTGICPFISFQQHWTPGDGSPVIDPPNTILHNLAHTHIECNLPHLGELGGPVTVPCRLQLFHTAGQIAQWLQLGQVTNLTMDPPTATQANAFPVIGNPNGVVIANFHATFDPRVQNRIDEPSAFIIQDHGWANLDLGVRTFFDNGDTADASAAWTIWSIVNPASPVGPEGEGRQIQFGMKSTAVSVRDTVSGPWGAHWIEFRDANLPLWAPITVPMASDAFSYTYSTDVPFLTAYHLVCDNDYHAGIVGNEMTFVTATNPITGQPFNHDFIDPLRISQSTAPNGFPAGVHRCTSVWQEGTPDTQGIPAPEGGVVAAGETLFSLVSFDVAVGPNPVGCNATCSNAIGASPGTPAPVVPPVVPPVVVIPDPPPPPPPPPPIETFTTVCTVQFQTGSAGHSKTLSTCPTN